MKQTKWKESPVLERKENSLRGRGLLIVLF